MNKTKSLIITIFFTVACQSNGIRPMGVDERTEEIQKTCSAYGTASERAAELRDRGIPRSGVEDAYVITYPSADLKGLKSEPQLQNAFDFVYQMNDLNPYGAAAFVSSICVTKMLNIGNKEIAWGIYNKSIECQTAHTGNENGVLQCMDLYLSSIIDSNIPK